MVISASAIFFLQSGFLVGFYLYLVRLSKHDWIALSPKRFQIHPWPQTRLASPAGGFGRRVICYNTSHRRPSTQKLRHTADPLQAVQTSLDSGNLSLLEALRRRAKSQSLVVYLVGGPLRDALLGIPIKDVDLVVEGDAPALARQLSEELGGHLLVHPQFGTATVTLGDARLDLVTARSEVYPRPAALPQVTPGTIEDDLARRDFSINALALSLTEPHPSIRDPHDGVGDMGRGLIRVLHRRSFADDPTRILRAVRYEQRLGFRIEDETLSLAQEAMAQGHMASVSGDRVRHELDRILQEERPALPLRRAIELGILAAIHPALVNGEAVDRLEGSGPLQVLTDDAHVDETRAEDLRDGEGQPTVYPLVYLAALVYPLSPGDGEAIIRRLNPPGAWAEVVRDAIALRELEPELAGLSPSGLVRLVQGFSTVALLAVSRVTMSPAASRVLKDFLDELQHVAPDLKGGDLLALGVPSGPLVGKILAQLREAKLDRRVATSAQEKMLVKELLAQWGGQPGRG